MTELAQTLVFGVLTGSVYALMATGLTLTFGVMKIVNMAQGAFPGPVGLPSATGCGPGSGSTRCWAGSS